MCGACALYAPRIVFVFVCELAVASQILYPIQLIHPYCVRAAISTVTFVCVLSISTLLKNTLYQQQIETGLLTDRHFAAIVCAHNLILFQLFGNTERTNT